MKKETIIAILGTLVAVFVVLLIVGLAMPDESYVQEPDAFEEAFKSSFIDSCAIESGEVLCTCMYNVLEYTYGFEGLYEESGNFDKTGEFSPDFIDTAMICVE